ncbi:unnamed protein product [Ectocarpus sp. 12 AP-2014]
MSECDLLNLASIGKIQDNGFLMVLDGGVRVSSSRIRYVSANIHNAPFSARAFRHDPRLFVGKRVSACFSEHVAREVLTVLDQNPRSASESTHGAFTCDTSGARFFMTLTWTTSGPVIEILPDDIKPRFDVIHYTNVLSKMPAHKDQAALFEAAVSIVTDVLHYDRSMIYRFQEDLSGKVVYERIRPCLEGTIEPYLNLYFPASDIPLPARQMFMSRPLRVVFDNNGEPVDIIGDNDDGTMDLSKCVLRANHPVHATYMKNMGVSSSMSIAIVVENDLWGLLSFQSCGEEPLHPRGWETILFENLSVIVSNCVSKITDDIFEARLSTLSSVVDKGFSLSNDVFEFFSQNATEFIAALKADCLCLLRGDRIHSWGDASLVVTAEMIESVARGAIGESCAVGELDDPSRGVLCIDADDVVVVCIKKSIASDKVWAGDPSHIKIMRPDGVPGPRASFERYIQSGADRLNRWDEQDQKLAYYLASRIKIFTATIKHLGCNYSVTQGTGDGPRLPPGQVGYHTSKITAPVLDAALISHFSHEIKTQIHGASTAITLLLEDLEMSKSDTRENLLYSLTCIKGVSKMVGSVLSIAGGGSAGSQSTHDVEKLGVQNLIDSLAKEFGDRTTGFTSVNNVDTDHGHIMVDSRMLHDTLRGIIENALSSTGSESIHVSASCCATHREATMAWMSDTGAFLHRNIRNADDASGISESDVWYTFSVKDTGCGIHADMLNNVLAYKDDTHAPSTLTKSHQGVGVDVYQCVSNIIFHMKGSVAIASTLSEGTIVSMMIPCRVTSSLTTKEGSQPDAGVFFVVDDNKVNRKLAARLIKVAFKKATGLTPMVMEFADGRLCVEEIKRVRASGKNIVGILMDHHMPVMTGKEATRHIRAIEAKEGLPKIPIFGFTADSTDTTKRELLNSGMDDVLPKPLPMKILEEACFKIMMTD